MTAAQKMVDMSAPRATVEMMTPDVARHLLEKNANNRTLNADRVTSLKKAIQRGEWVLDGNPIRISEEGHLLDGQHRLSAIVLADAPCQTLVVRGLKNESMLAMDQGKSRSMADVLSINGYKYAHQVASFLRGIVAVQDGQAPAGSRAAKELTSAQALKMLEDQPELYTFVEQSFNRYMKPAAGLYPLTPALAFYWFMHHQDEELARDFMDTLFGLRASTNDDPAFMLRQRLVRAQNSKADSVTNEMKHAFFVKAWRAYRANQSIDRFVYRKYGSRAEAFPSIFDKEENK